MTPPAAGQPPFDPRTPFSRAAARAAGISWRRLAGPTFHRIFHDSYVAAQVPLTVELRAAAALALCDPGAHASHHTAARLLGGVVPEDPDTHVSVPAGSHRPRREGIRAHVSPASVAVVTRRGVRCSSAVQCVRELAPRLGLVDLVVLGDSLVTAGQVSPAELEAAADGWSGRGARQARRAMRLVRSGVDSPMETRLRLLIVLAGLPEPVVNHILLNEDGRTRYRLDLSYPQWRIAIEYDGRQHAESPQQWGHDLTRREALDAMAWRLIIARATDVYGDPAGTLARIVAVIVERGVVGVRVRSEEWTRHFPGRVAAA